MTWWNAQAEKNREEYYYPHRILGNERLFEAKGVPIRIKKPYLLIRNAGPAAQS